MGPLALLHLMRTPTIIREIVTLTRSRRGFTKLELSELDGRRCVRLSFGRPGDFAPFALALSRSEAEALAAALMTGAQEAD